MTDFVNQHVDVRLFGFCRDFEHPWIRKLFQSLLFSHMAIVRFISSRIASDIEAFMLTFRRAMGSGFRSFTEILIRYVFLNTVDGGTLISTRP